jgi:hypothetical protein
MLKWKKMMADDAIEKLFSTAVFTQLIWVFKK